LLGDAGSGFWIGHQAVRAAAAALDRRGPATALAEAVAAQLGVEASTARGRYGRVVALGHAVDELYRVRPVELAAFAPLVFTAATAGDEVAGEIVLGAATALAATLAAVTTDGEPGPLVLGGSILARQRAIAEHVVGSFRASGSTEPVVTVADGLAGAAVLALRHAGSTVDDDAHARIKSSLAALAR
jgi:N-acetylglucosamine kinase-like BadF-type ATPase